MTPGRAFCFIAGLLIGDALFDGNIDQLLFGSIIMVLGIFMKDKN